MGAALTLLFLDLSGVLHTYLGWLAKVQLLPAILALNVGVVAVLLVLTLLFGRLYCSVICPLGVMQDVVARLGLKAKRNRYGYSPAKQWLRYGVFVLFVVLMVAGVGAVASLIAPYSAFGRIVTNLVAPVWQWGNNLLAWASERMGNYAFYSVEVWWRGGVTFAAAVVSFAVVALLAWRNGRTWCNTICPVGTLLGFVSRFSLLRPVIDTSKCNGCGLCARNCKAASIDPKNHTVDMSRCVVCFDCIDSCKKGAIAYRRRATKPVVKTDKSEKTDTARRSFLTISALFAGTLVANAKKQHVDGGLAVVVDKEAPARKTRIAPPGAMSLKNLNAHCTGCQLCVSACKQQVLRPSNGVMTLMQPEASYERGYCRVECTACSEVCPTGAIRPITRAEKSSIQIGRAVWIKQNCLAAEGVKCDNCARHCPTEAIRMVEHEGRRVPAIDTERCIGCGACEHLCPSRPFSAIYVEGNQTHRTL
ncbi:MAG: 4Fe-4S binding protein [Alistipes sp.]|nr:4Fe-4S binding protein [Alistipes sp.]